MKRTRLAPPPHLSKSIPTKLASGTADIARLVAQGWTIVEDGGHAIVEEHHNGTSTDVPPNISQRIDQVLGEAPKRKRGRPRIGRPATAVLAAILTLTTWAQQPLTRLNFDTAEVYTMQRVSGYFKHPDGGDVALIVVRAQGTGAMYRVVMRMEYIEGVKPGDTLTIDEVPLP